MTERDIFHAAIALADPVERSAYVAKACAGDAALQQHVEEMLGVYPSLGAFLEAPAIEWDGTARPPTRAGRFHLGAELARGGMGVVYSARDESLGRDVAVKVLHERYRLDALVNQRFLDEARFTAQLQHPGIPPVFEVGRLEDERPYLAMKLIKGRTLADLLNERPEPASDRGRFLAVFQQICQAVGYAHSHGVLHRDLKPANVMVGAFGEVQVMDWGVAKLLAPGAAVVHEPAAGTEAMCGTVIQTSRQSDATLAGCVVGTPAFMAPEQAGGALDRHDERTDVFGLGAILCVILTGNPPYTSASGDDVRAMAILGALADAHVRLEQCGADAKLVELCRACLSAERDARPRDAAAVAATVAGYLAGVEARARQAETARAEAVVREAEQRKRRRTVQAAGGVIAAVLLAGLGVSLWQTFRAQGAEAQANQNARKALDEANAKDVALIAEQEARADEAKARQQAFAALRSMTADVIEKKFAQGTVLTEDDRAFLRGIIVQFDAFAASKGDDADSRALRAEVRLRVGNIRCALGELKEAEADYDQALGAYRQLVDDFPARPTFRQGLAMSHNRRGLERRHTGRPKEAEADYDQAVSIQTQLTATFPAHPRYRQDLATSAFNRGELLNAAGRLPEAERDFDQALSIRAQLAAGFPDRTEFQKDLALSHNMLGIQLRAKGQPTAAETHYGQALHIRKRLADHFPTNPELQRDLAASHNNRGNLLGAMYRHKEAEAEYNQAVRISKQLAADFPARPEFRRDLAASHDNRGILLSAIGRPTDAEADFDQAVRINKQLAADFPARPEFRQLLAKSHNHRGNLLSARGRRTEAADDYDQAVRINKQLAAEFPTHPEFSQDLAASQMNRGGLHYATGRPNEAQQDYDESVRAYRQLATDFPDRPEFRVNLAKSHNNRGALRHVTRQLREAEKDYSQALSILKQLARDFPAHVEYRQELAGSHNNRAALLFATRRPRQAEQDYDQALSIYRKLAADSPDLPDLHNGLARTCGNLALLHWQQGRWAPAKQILNEARPHHLAALKANPRHAAFRQSYRTYLSALTAAHAGLLEPEDAVRTAETCRDLGWNALADAYDAACYMSLCIPIVAKHPQLDDKQRKEAVHFYGDAAMKLLGAAVSKGYRDVAHLTRDADLNPLRERADFQKLVAELKNNRN